jgi:hypothetical protein
MNKEKFLGAIDAMIASFDRRSGQTEPSNGPTKTAGFLWLSADLDVLDVWPLQNRPCSAAHINIIARRSDIANTSDDSRVESPFSSLNVQDVQSRDECFWHLAHGKRKGRAVCVRCRRFCRPSEEVLELADRNAVHIALSDCHGAPRRGRRWKSSGQIPKPPACWQNRNDLRHFEPRRAAMRTTCLGGSQGTGCQQ